jgi:hypothetical protein
MPSRGLGPPRGDVKYQALRYTVELEMSRRGWEVADLARHSGISENTLRGIGVRELQPRVVRKLVVLGLSPARVDALKAAGLMAGESGYDEATLTIAALCAGMPDWQRAVILDLARSLIARGPEQSD